MARAAAPSRRDLDPDTLAALEEQRDFLLASLRDLEAEHDAGDIDDVDYEALKDDYTARAAAVLRAVETRKARIAEGRRPRSGWRIGLTALGVVCFAVLIGVAVGQASGERTGSETATGDLPATSRQKLLDAQALWQSDPMGALEIYDEVLADDPSNVEAMAYRGWLLRNVGAQAAASEREVLWAGALEDLDDAVATDPDYADARVFRASLRLDLGDVDGAAEDLAAIEQGSLPEFMAPMIDALAQRIEGAGSPSTTATPDPAAEGGSGPG